MTSCEGRKCVVSSDAPSSGSTPLFTPNSIAYLHCVRNADLIPAHKADLAAAERAVAAGYPAVQPVLGDLFQWLQDGNWPVFVVLAPFIASLGAVSADEVRRVLQSEDDVW